MSLKIGQRVSVKVKDRRLGVIAGVIAYIGKTSFAEGKWIGVILDKPLGKNNGTIHGKEYFKCEENHGTMVRQQQITLVDDAGPIFCASMSITVSSTGEATTSEMLLGPVPEGFSFLPKHKANSWT